MNPDETTTSKLKNYYHICINVIFVTLTGQAQGLLHLWCVIIVSLQSDLS